MAVVADRPHCHGHCILHLLHIDTAEIPIEIKALNTAATNDEEHDGEHS
jgi:hypothetical protein